LAGACRFGTSIDAGGDGVARLLPDGSLGGQLLDTFDAAVKALGRQHADLDFHHVQPAGMFGDVVELESVGASGREIVSIAVSM
jgi:hypothetical protein